MSNSIIRIGTRGSKLARWQTDYAVRELCKVQPGLQIEIKEIKTKGDKILDAPLAKIGGKGLFTQEIEKQMLQGEIDCAVHSLKDLPTVLPQGLAIGAVPVRADARDALVSDKYQSLQDLPAGAKVGTSSLRRQAQLLAIRPDLQLVSLRGNVDTRLRKMKQEGLDAIVLAAAGLSRLQYADRIVEYLDFAVCLPAAGQGALALEVRQDDLRLQKLLQKIHHAETFCSVTAERAFLCCLGGGCQVPVGAFASLQEGRLTLQGVVAAADGSEFYRGRVQGKPEEAELLGKRLAAELLTAGGKRIMRQLGIQPEEVC